MPVGGNPPTKGAASEGVISGKAAYPAGTDVGVVRGPLGVVAAGGANAVSAGGANAVSGGGANVVSSGGGNLRAYGLLAVEEAPVAVAEVFVADAAGNPIPGLKRVKSDSKGRFAIPDVPAGYTYVVVARIKTAAGDEAALKTLAKVTTLGTTVDVGTASTLVTTAAVAGRSDALGEFNPATFQRAIEATARHLSADLVPDLADTGAILASMTALGEQVSELKTALGTLQSELAEVKQRLADLEATIKQGASAAPTATPAATATASTAPTSAPTAAATPTPTPTASVALSPYLVATLAGSGTRGFVDGASATAQFSGMRGLSLDAAGNAFVVETGNQRVRKVAGDGTVSTYAGSGAQGYFDGAREVAKFASPSDTVMDAQGNVYVSEAGNRRIRVVATDGTVGTWAGDGTLASADGLGTKAKFMAPRGLAWAGGVLYVADSNANCIRKIGADGTVTTLVGADGQPPAAIQGPTDVAVDQQGNVFVALADKHQVVKIAADGTVTVVAGGAMGAADGPAASASFNQPTGLAVDRRGNLYVADTSNHRIRMIAPNGTVSTLAGGASGYQDGSGEQALFKNPYDIEVDDTTGKLYVTENQGNRVRVLTPR
ncbi:Serine/threonine-protein kinase PknD [compost metagenome]